MARGHSHNYQPTGDRWWEGPDRRSRMREIIQHVCQADEGDSGSSRCRRPFRNVKGRRRPATPAEIGEHRLR